ncbi:caspase family protein [Henriciella sp. AS95]|uniref:caspase family protein n=1 Tax=Henriciella sp. AS95 TaxID=3135782 RepID=UPI00316E4AD3
MRILIASALAGLFALPMMAEPRIALVIGNSTYETPGWALENPERDARLMKAALEGLDYEVMTVLNADEDGMEQAFADFGAALKEAGPDATGFFFFAGHGVQSEGLNYLIPTDLVAYNEADIWANAPRLELLFRYLENAGNAANFIVLDACRNNPLPAAVRSTAGGLAPAGRVRGTLIAYSTAPGAVAEDGVDGNSEFTLALSELISQPGVSAETLFRRVATRVEQRTGYRQQPWVESGLRGTQDYCFAGCDADEGEKAEAAALMASLTSESPGVLKSFLAAFPNTKSRSLVETRLRQLEAPDPTEMEALSDEEGASLTDPSESLDAPGDVDISRGYNSEGEIIDPSESQEEPESVALTEGQVKAILGVDTLIGDMVSPWRKDVMQTAAKAAFMTRTSDGAPEFSRLDDDLFVFFGFESAEITPEAAEHLELFADYSASGHAENGTIRVVSGCSGDEMKLSICRERAKAVEAYLVAQGVPQEAFESYQNYGKHRPLQDPGFGIDEKAMNRYAMVQLLE